MTASNRVKPCEAEEPLKCSEGYKTSIQTLTTLSPDPRPKANTHHSPWNNCIKDMAEKDSLTYKKSGARDVADIWNDAIRQYHGIGGKDLKAGYDRFKSVDAMVDFGCKEMESFHAFRYDGTKVSKLRSLFKDGMWLIEGGMQQVVAAATPAFPPAAAVGTALTYMLTVSNTPNFVHTR